MTEPASSPPSGASGSSAEAGTEAPRLAPLPPAEWNDLLRTLLSRSPGGLERPMNIFTTLARHPDLFRKWLGFGGALLDGKLGARQRELVILRTAHRCQSDYEWAQHVRLAALAEVSGDEVGALREPLAAWDWSEEDRLVLEGTDELLETSSITDPTWDALSKRLDDAGLIELVMLVGHYQMLAMTLRTLRVQVEA